MNQLCGESPNACRPVLCVPQFHRPINRLVSNGTRGLAFEASFVEVFLDLGKRSCSIAGQGRVKFARCEEGSFGPGRSLAVACGEGVARFVLWHYASVTPETSSKRARTCRDVPRGTITQTQGNRKVGPSVRCCRQWPSTTEVYKEYAQVGRRNAADARGLAQRAGTHLGQFLPRFKRERGNVGVIRSFC